MASVDVPMQLTNARDAVVKLVRQLHDAVRKLSSESYDPKTESVPDRFMNRIEDLNSSIGDAEVAVAPVECELQVASNGVRSSHLDAIGEAKKVRDTLELVRTGRVTRDAVLRWSACTTLVIDRLLTGIAHCSSVYEPKSGIDFEMNRAAVLRMARPQTPSAGVLAPVEQRPQPAEAPRTRVSVRTQRSTQPRRAHEILVAALTKHHKYSGGGCLNLAPIGNNELVS